MGYQGETRYKLVEVHPQRSHKLQQASMDGAFIGAGSLYWTFIGLLAFSWLVAREPAKSKYDDNYSSFLTQGQVNS